MQSILSAQFALLLFDKRHSCLLAAVVEPKQVSALCKFFNRQGAAGSANDQLPANKQFAIAAQYTDNSTRRRRRILHRKQIGNRVGLYPNQASYITNDSYRTEKITAIGILHL
jgi:hypothetical protein